MVSNRTEKCRESVKCRRVIRNRSGKTTRGIDAVLRAGNSVSGVIRSAVTHRPVADTCVIAVPGKYSLPSQGGRPVQSGFRRNREVGPVHAA